MRRCRDWNRSRRSAVSQAPRARGYSVGHRHHVGQLLGYALQTADVRTDLLTDTQLRRLAKRIERYFRPGRWWIDRISKDSRTAGRVLPRQVAPVSNRRSVNDRYNATDPRTARICGGQAGENLWNVLLNIDVVKMKKPSFSQAWLHHVAVVRVLGKPVSPENSLFGGNLQGNLRVAPEREPT